MKIKLKDIAYARSGDKGSDSNIGLIFKSIEQYDWAKNNITEEIVSKYFKDIAKGGAVRYELPNLCSFNFILKDSLGGGGSASLFHDAQGKTHGQLLLMMDIEIPKTLFEENEGD